MSTVGASSKENYFYWVSENTEHYKLALGTTRHSIGRRLDYLLYYNGRVELLTEINALKKSNYGLIMAGGVKCEIENIQIGIRSDYYLNFAQVASWPV